MTPNAPSITGGCQCGAVRYHASVALTDAHICHCRMCQKAVGNAFAALAAAPRDAISWTRGTPAVFKSSGQVARGFCKDCGTPLFYDYLEGRRINLTIGSLDDPGKFPPHEQFGIEARLDWFAGLSALPEAGTTEQTMAGPAPKIRASNCQHPDHETKKWPL
jgi:hypothetical protein